MKSTIIVIIIILQNNGCFDFAQEGVRLFVSRIQFRYIGWKCQLVSCKKSSSSQCTDTNLGLFLHKDTLNSISRKLSRLFFI